MANGTADGKTSNSGLVGAGAVSGAMVAQAASEVSIYYLSTPEPIKGAMSILLIFGFSTLGGWLAHLATRVDRNQDHIPDFIQATEKPNA